MRNFLSISIASVITSPLLRAHMESGARRDTVKLWKAGHVAAEVVVGCGDAGESRVFCASGGARACEYVSGEGDIHYRGADCCKVRM